MAVLRYMFREGHPVDVIWFVAGGALLLLFLVVFVRGVWRSRRKK